jgi:hypothetical protein
MTRKTRLRIDAARRRAEVKEAIRGGPKKLLTTVTSESAKNALKACDKYGHTAHSVYFVRCGEFVKIGYTTAQPQTRVEAFDAPYDVTLLASVPGGLRLERSLRRTFKDLHHRREWFRYEGGLKEFVGAIEGVRWARRPPADEAIDYGFEELKEVA